MQACKPPRPISLFTTRQQTRSRVFNGSKWHQSSSNDEVGGHDSCLDGITRTALLSWEGDGEGWKTIGIVGSSDDTQGEQVISLVFFKKNQSQVIPRQFVNSKVLLCTTQLIIPFSFVSLCSFSAILVCPHRRIPSRKAVEAAGRRTSGVSGASQHGIALRPDFPPTGVPHFSPQPNLTA